MNTGALNLAKCQELALKKQTHRVRVPMAVRFGRVRGSGPARTSGGPVSCVHGSSSHRSGPRPSRANHHWAEAEKACIWVPKILGQPGPDPGPTCSGPFPHRDDLLGPVGLARCSRRDPRGDALCRISRDPLPGKGRRGLLHFGASGFALRGDGEHLHRAHPIWVREPEMDSAAAPSKIGS